MRFRDRISGIYSKLDGKNDEIRDSVATTNFQPSQSPFLLDFAVLPRISSFFLTILLFIPEIRSLNRIIGRKIFRKQLELLQKSCFSGLPTRGIRDEMSLFRLTLILNQHFRKADSTNVTWVYYPFLICNKNSTKSILFSKDRLQTG